ncbi:MAG: Arc family DNA binding domain-containing protein [Gammaproteobacteria bacterium]
MKKKGFALRINGDILDAVRRWSDDELRSVNAQIEYVLRDGLRRAGRLPPSSGADTEPSTSLDETE